MKNRIVIPKHDVKDGDFLINEKGKKYRILTDIYYNEFNNLIVEVESEDVPKWRKNEYTLGLLYQVFEVPESQFADIA